MRGIGRCAVKLESCLDRCVNVLLFLLQSNISYVAEQVVIVLIDLLRRFPGRFTPVIVPICNAMDLLEQPLARASLIWVVGEYAQVIENAEALLDLYVDSFHDEQPIVQMQLLTAAVKVFLWRPASSKQLLTTLLTMATAESLSIPLRDRAYL